VGLSAPIVGTPALINTGAASGTVVVPVTAQAGDRLLLIIAYGGGGIPSVVSGGGISGGAGGPWPSLPTFPVGGTAPGTALDIRTGVCNARDIGATLTVFFNTATAKAIMWVEAWRDPNGTPAINQASGKLAAAATALTTNSITPNVVGCWVASYFTSRDSSIGTTYLPGTDSGSGGALTERDDQTNTGTSEVAAELCDTNATVSSGVATVHSSTSSQSLAYCAGIIAIAPGSFFPTDQQIISSQLHPGRTPSRVARFRTPPRSTVLPVAGGETHSSSLVGQGRLASLSSGVKGGLGSATDQQRPVDAATSAKGGLGAATSQQHSADTTTTAKGALGAEVAQQRSTSTATGTSLQAKSGSATATQRSQSISTGAKGALAVEVAQQRSAAVSSDAKGGRGSEAAAARSASTVTGAKATTGIAAAAQRSQAAATGSQATGHASSSTGQTRAASVCSGRKGGMSSATSTAHSQTVNGGFHASGGTSVGNLRAQAVLFTVPTFTVGTLTATDRVAGTLTANITAGVGTATSSSGQLTATDTQASTLTATIQAGGPS